MSLQIWKHKLGVGNQMHHYPVGARPLAVQIQRGVPRLWMIVESDDELVEYQFRVVGTGHELDFIIKDDATVWNYLGTFQIADGSLVFHAFWDGPPR